MITIHQRHRQTDGQTDDMRLQYRALHCSASRGKNGQKCLFSAEILRQPKRIENREFCSPQFELRGVLCKWDVYDAETEKTPRDGNVRDRDYNPASSHSSPSFSPCVTTSTFHSTLKAHLFHKSLPPVTLQSFRTDFMDLNLYWITGHWGTALFVLVSDYVC